MSNGAIAVVIGLAIAGAVAVYVWFDRHPCVRWEQSTCNQCAHSAWLNGAYTCWAWESVPCTVCAERAP